MTSCSYTNLITPQDLNALMDQGTTTLKILDCSYALPHMNVDVRAAYSEKRIDHAGFFDIDAIAQPDTDLPHMMPSAADFTRAMQDLGLNKDDLIVIYHNSGIPFASTRAWWMLRAFGHEAVCVLDGGLKAWEDAGFPVNHDAPSDTPEPGNFTAQPAPQLLTTKDSLYALLPHSGVSILDARSAARFQGEEDEPRPGLRRGHIPGAYNIPFPALIDEQTGCFKSESALKELFAQTLDANEIITMCGSGVTACILTLGLHILGREDVSVYDGAWAEWGEPKANMPYSA